MTREATTSHRSPRDGPPASAERRRRHGIRPALMRRPRIRSSTGSSSTEVRIEKATTTTAPSAIEVMTPSGTRNRVAHRGDDGDPGEDHRLAAGSYRDGERLVDGAALGQLLLEPGDDEQRVVDADPEAEHRGGVLDEQRQLGLARDDRQDGEACQDRRDADRQRHQRRDETAVQRQQHQQDQRQGEHLRVRQPGLAQRVDLAPERRGPDQRHVEALRRILRRQVLLEVRQELPRHAVVDPETQDLDRGRPVLADELLLAPRRTSTHTRAGW